MLIIKKNNMCIMGVPAREGREKEPDSLLK